MSITIKPRKDLGFADESFPAYVFFLAHDPILQLHLYHDYYTIFWRGRVGLKILKEWLEKLISKEDKTLARGLAQYGSSKEHDVIVRPFVVKPRNSQDRSIQFDHERFLADHGPAITFVRYDIEGDVPLILWADVTNSEHAEIGFSSKDTLPSAILGLLHQTSTKAISSSTMSEIEEGILKRIKGEHTTTTR